MESVIQTVGYLIALFLASLCASYLVGRLLRRAAPRLPQLTVGTSCRLVGTGGVYRCYLGSVKGKGLEFSAPLQRDHYVPLRVGEALMVQIPVQEGVVSFRSVVVERDAERHTFRMAAPTHFRTLDRRSEPRDDSVYGREVALNGQAAEVLNVSAGGALVVTTLDVQPGDRIDLQLGGSNSVCPGWALESVPTTLGQQAARSVRVRFESPLAGLVRR